MPRGRGGEQGWGSPLQLVVFGQELFIHNSSRYSTHDGMCKYAVLPAHRGIYLCLPCRATSESTYARKGQKWQLQISHDAMTVHTRGCTPKSLLACAICFYLMVELASEVEQTTPMTMTFCVMVW